MKQLLQTKVIFILLLCILPACRKDTHSSATPQPPVLPPPAGSAPYSGKWTGIINVTAKYPDLCYWSGGTVAITQNWVVVGDSVQVEDIMKDSGGTYTYYWRGIIRNDTLEMTSKRNISCSGVMNAMEMVVKTPISSLTDKYSIQTSADYVPCPPNCAFVFDFIISKSK
jgi:hypothetical protein